MPTSKITFCILVAMEDEAQRMIDQFQLQKNSKAASLALPFQHFSGHYHNLQLHLITSGKDSRFNVDNIGSEAATLMAHDAISRYKPDFIISAGTAGGFANKGAKIGTLYLSAEQFIYHDRIVPLPGFKESSIGSYLGWDTTEAAQVLNIKRGIISTGSSLKKSPADIEVIESFNAVAKEMEAAAIAWVANLHKTPVLALKSITNLVDLDNLSEQEFVTHFDSACQSLADGMLDLMNYFNDFH